MELKHQLTDRKFNLPDGRVATILDLNAFFEVSGDHDDVMVQLSAPENAFYGQVVVSDPTERVLGNEEIDVIHPDLVIAIEEDLELQGEVAQKYNEMGGAHAVDEDAQKDAMLEKGSAWNLAAYKALDKDMVGVVYAISAATVEKAENRDAGAFIVGEDVLFTLPNDTKTIAGRIYEIQESGVYDIEITEPSLQGTHTNVAAENIKKLPSEDQGAEEPMNFDGSRVGTWDGGVEDLVAEQVQKVEGDI